MPFKLHFFKHAPATQTGKPKYRVSYLSLLAGLLFVIISSYLIYSPPETIPEYDHNLKLGDIAREDIVVHKTAQLIDKEKTNELRKKVISTIIPIYEYSPENQTKSINAITGWFKFIRNARLQYAHKKESFQYLTQLKSEVESQVGLELSETEIRMLLETRIFEKINPDQLLQFIEQLYNKKILNSIPGAIRSKEETIKLVIKNSEPVILSIESLYDLKRVKTELVEYLKQQKISFAGAEFAASILNEFLNANVLYSVYLTRKEEQRLSSEVNPVYATFKTGKIILRKGDEVSPRHLKQLKMLSEINPVEESRLSNFYFIALIMLFITVFGSRFFNVWVNSGINKDRIYIVTGATILLSIILYRVSMFLFPLILKNITISIPYDVSSMIYAIPSGVRALTIAFIFNLQGAVIFSFLNAIVGGILCEWDFNVFIYILLGNLAASYGIEFYQRLKRSPIIKASILWMLPINILVITFVHLTQQEINLIRLAVNLSMGIFSVLVSLVIANFLIPVWEMIFKLITEIKLIELTNLNLPIFREMLEKAPGTYHHSLMVASLSEAVAQDLGLSPLLQRAMALYHDIGKIDNPHFFTENHTIYKNPHDSMAPRDSAKNIISHIPDGLDRAEKLHIPAMISSAIRQHHGRKRVRYFYDKAREMSAVDSDEFDDKAFRYQGEKPRNIENAIIMLADQVEAASKSLASPSDDEIKNVIQKIIDTNIEEEQFDECDGLTFKAINIMANSFLKKLSSIYHMRISYPGFNFKEKESTDDAARTRPQSDKFRISV